jgi:hypothetical protein
LQAKPLNAAMQHSCVQRTKLLDSALESCGNMTKRWNRHSRMRQPSAAQTSSLPSLMMPCPACGGRMAYQGRRAIAPDLEDTVYACRNCGTELVRTSVRKAKSDATKPAEAA